MSTLHTHELGPRVLAVASVNEKVGDWAVYIDSISEEYDLESNSINVAKMGVKTSQKVGEALFPEFAKQYRWRS